MFTKLATIAIASIAVVTAMPWDLKDTNDTYPLPLTPLNFEAEAHAFVWNG